MQRFLAANWNNIRNKKKKNILPDQAWIDKAQIKLKWMNLQFKFSINKVEEISVLMSKMLYFKHLKKNPL
jgi:hypothetical protein